MPIPSPLFSLEVTGTDTVQKGLASIQDNLGDLTPFWRDVFAPIYLGVVQDLFATSGTPRGQGGKFTGGPWAKYSPKYAIWKYKHYPGRPILTRTGALRDSLRWDGQIGPGGTFVAMPNYVVVGTSVKYGVFHQKGTKHMPKRDFLPDPDPKVFTPLMQQWLLKKKGP